MGQEREPAAPWWRNGRTITALAALFAAVVPITTVLEGYVDKQRSGALEALKYAEAARESYLDRISKTTNAERLAVLRFVLATSSDPKLLEWAQTEKALVDADVKTEKEIADAEAKAKAQTAQLQAALTTATSDAGHGTQEISEIQSKLTSTRNEVRAKRQNLRLPVAANLATQQAAPRPAATILWIDASPSNNLALRDVFDAYGWSVVPVSSIAEAEKALGANPVDLIISDGFIDSLNGRKSRIPYIVFTSNKAIRDDAAKHGAFGGTDRPSALLQMVMAALPRSPPAAAD
jgi:CheY-like chemotaxis protein